MYSHKVLYLHEMGQTPQISLSKFLVSKQVLYEARKRFIFVETWFCFHLVRVLFSITKHRKGQQCAKESTHAWDAQEESHATCFWGIWTLPPVRHSRGRQEQWEALPSTSAAPSWTEGSTHLCTHSGMNGNLVRFQSMQVLCVRFSNFPSQTDTGSIHTNGNKLYKNYK